MFEILEHLPNILEFFSVKLQFKYIVQFYDFNIQVTFSDQDAKNYNSGLFHQLYARTHEIILLTSFSAILHSEWQKLKKNFANDGRNFRVLALLSARLKKIICTSKSSSPFQESWCSELIGLHSHNWMGDSTKIKRFIL